MINLLSKLNSIKSEREQQEFVTKFKTALKHLEKLFERREDSTELCDFNTLKEVLIESYNLSWNDLYSNLKGKGCICFNENQHELCFKVLKYDLTVVENAAILIEELKTMKYNFVEYILEKLDELGVIKYLKYGQPLFNVEGECPDPTPILDSIISNNFLFQLDKIIWHD